ncbi:N-methyl-L-tryptophan oxidase [Spelaeicoccus albus]|uniref:Sarcosine oxidase n=1 Tax=Spelaeicoccus albus TaxID=1280376 RepID=A0A7Z0D4M4_9MICO|nr:N-methyl-L-tryptophan oxidase [Spelaeicoccus albus]NYI68804.1 sarcosine oxidase [Spelaeicoccus albus]
MAQDGYDADVAVIGVGTMGSMACWQLAKRGVSVVGFEQFAPGHDRSGAGGESRLFRTAYLEGPQYVPLLLAAQEQWRNLESDVGRELLTLNGGLMIGQPDSEFLTSVMASIQSADLPHEILNYNEATKRYPQHRLHRDEIMIFDRQAGFIRPELSVALAADASESMGARILRRERVNSVEPDEQGVTVVTSNGVWRTRKVVIAAGAWSQRLCPKLTPTIRLQRLVMTWFPLRDPASYTPDRFPIFIRQTEAYDISGWPTLDSTSLKVAVNFGYDMVDDPDGLDRTVNDHLLDTIRKGVRELLPDAINEPMRIGAYMDGYTDDRDAIVGYTDDLPNTIAMYGFSGHGFKMAPAIGQAVADLVADGQTQLPIDHLDPNRLTQNRQPPKRLRTIAGESGR